MSRKETDYKRSNITADEAAPTESGTWLDPEGFAEAAWYLTAASESDTCTIRPWYLRDGAPHKGDTADVTGSTVVLGYTMGRPCAIQLINVTGTWSLGADLVNQ